MQKLITAEIKKAAKKYPLYSQDGKNGDAVVLARFFTPYSNYTWYLLEYNEATGEGFGYVVGPEHEYGYINVNELQSIKQKVRLLGHVAELQAVERDIFVHPAKETLESLLKAHDDPIPSWWSKNDEEESDDSVETVEEKVFVEV